MSVKIITTVSGLMRVAHELGQARLAGDADRIAAAQQAHDDYVDAVRQSDEMWVDSGLPDGRGRR